MGGVVFDLDGTLVDSVDDIVQATNTTLRQHHLPERTRAEIASYVGDGPLVLLCRASGLPPSSRELSRLLETYLEFYAAHAHDHTVLMPGAVEVLSLLRELPLALCTQKPRRSTLALLDHLALRERFALIVAQEDCPRHKPDPEPLLCIAAALAIPPALMVMVGDGPQDVESGRAAGMRTVGVVGCFVPRERLRAAQPDVLIDALTQLPAVLLGWRRAEASREARAP